MTTRLDEVQARCRLEELVAEVVSEAKALSPELGVEFLAEALLEWSRRAEAHIPASVLVGVINDAD